MALGSLAFDLYQAARGNAKTRGPADPACGVRKRSHWKRYEKSVEEDGRSRKRCYVGNAPLKIDINAEQEGGRDRGTVVWDSGEQEGAKAAPAGRYSFRRIDRWPRALEECSSIGGTMECLNRNMSGRGCPAARRCRTPTKAPAGM